METVVKSKRVIAEVIDPCDCNRYGAGKKVVLNGLVPEGFCDIGYLELKKQAEGLLDQVDITRLGSGRIVVRCPHFNGAIWQLRLEETDRQPTP